MLVEVSDIASTHDYINLVTQVEVLVYVMKHTTPTPHMHDTCVTSHTDVEFRVLLCMTFDILHPSHSHKHTHYFNETRLNSNLECCTWKTNHEIKCIGLCIFQSLLAPSLTVFLYLITITCVA